MVGTHEKAGCGIKEALQDTTGAGSGKLHFEAEISDFYFI